MSEHHDPEIAAIVGPARLAYCTPTGEFPVLADRKAAFLLTASGLIVTVLIFFMQPIVEVIRGPHRLLAVAIGLLVAAILALVMLAAHWAYKAFVRPLPEMPQTLAFYRHIATNPLDTYAESMKSLTHPEALRSILHYNYSVACLGAEKFRLIQRSLRCMRAAILLWMLLLLIVAVV
jgi:hypothetical protein